MAAVSEAAAAEKATANATCTVLDSQDPRYDPQVVADLSSLWLLDAEPGVLAGGSSSASSAVGAGAAAGVATNVQPHSSGDCSMCMCCQDICCCKLYLELVYGVSE